MDKKLLLRLRELTASLVEAEQGDDTDLVEAIQEEIWELQDIIEEESEIDYADNHNKNWQ